jgi:hypothetical protein
MSDPIKYKQHIKKNIKFNMKILDNIHINDNYTLKSLMRMCTT